MKKLIQKILILFAVVFALDKAVGFFMLKCLQNYRVDNRLSELINKKVKPEIIIMGSSRAARDVSAEIIEKETGHETYNIGYPGSDQEFHETILKIITDYGVIPKVLILAVDDDLHFTINLPSYYRTDVLYENLEFDKVLKAAVKKDGKNYLLSKLFLTYRLNVKKFDVLRYLINGTQVPDKLTKVSSRGSMLLEGKSVTYDELKFSATSRAYRKNDEREILVKRFADINKECDEHGIELILFLPPNYKQPSQQFKDRIAELSGNRSLIDLSSSLLEKEYFYDESHLNNAGARILSVQLAFEINRLVFNKF